MSNNFYISDLHFGHANCLAFDNRPFKSIEHHDAELIRRWNSVVHPGDTVYILGDMFWCKATEAIEILKQLNGQKILTKGNHDRCHDINFKKCFVKICEYEEVEDDGDKIVLCHYPIPCFKNHFYDWLHFYGHVHTSFEYNMMQHNRYLMESLYDKSCRMYNVGAMLPYMDYTPRTKQEILNGGDAVMNEFYKAEIAKENKDE
jgi:calcineurin-like phosphoesterase family protein